MGGREVLGPAADGGHAGGPQPLEAVEVGIRWLPPQQPTNVGQERRGRMQ